MRAGLALPEKHRCATHYILILIPLFEIMHDMGDDEQDQREWKRRRWWHSSGSSNGSGGGGKQNVQSKLGFGVFLLHTIVSTFYVVLWIKKESLLFQRVAALASGDLRSYKSFMVTRRLDWWTPFPIVSNVIHLNAKFCAGWA